MLELQRQPWAGGAGPHLQRRDLVGVRPGARAQVRRPGRGS